MFIKSSAEDHMGIRHGFAELFAFVFVLVASASRIIAAASALATLNLAMLPVAAAEPAVRLTAYSWRAPAKIEAATDTLTFSGFGMLRLQSVRPLAGLQGSVTMNRGAVLLLETDDGWRQEIRFENDQPVELDVSFPTRVSGVMFAVICPGYQGWSVNQVRIMFADGSQIALSSLLVGDYQQLGPHNRLPRYDEPPTEPLSAEAARAAVEADWSAQRGQTPWPQAIADETRRLEQILQRRASKLAPAEIAGRRQRLAVVAAAAAGGPPDPKQAYHALRTLKREWLLADPEIDFTGILCIDVPYLTPLPVSENLFLVSARTGYAASIAAEPDVRFHRLYLMDYDGNMELLYTGRLNILHAQPIRPRRKPPILASSVKWPGPMTCPEQRPADGVFYSADVYEGSGIPRGKVKSLRVTDADSRTFGAPHQGLAYGWQLSHPYSKAGAMPVFDIVTEVPVSFLYADSTKRVLGTVPVEEDGSVGFLAPPLRTLYFQLLDEKGLCLQTMRSAVHVMPGEVRGCVGCHETRAVTPQWDRSASLAMRRAPWKIEPPPWGDASVSFPRFVQPVLDRHCVSCHKPGKAEGGFDFAHRAEDPLDFSWPYVKLVFGAWAPGKDVRTTTIANPIFPGLTYANPAFKYATQETVVPPMTAMSYRSRFVRIATSGEHDGVRVSPLESQQLIAWVDALCPYNGLEELLSRDDPDPMHSRAFPFPSKMRTAPLVHKAFRQDEFNTQADRIPRDADGNSLPSVIFENGRRTYRLPDQRVIKRPIDVYSSHQ